MSLKAQDTHEQNTAGEAEVLTILGRTDLFICMTLSFSHAVPLFPTPVLVGPLLENRRVEVRCKGLQKQSREGLEQMGWDCDPPGHCFILCLDPGKWSWRSPEPSWVRTSSIPWTCNVPGVGASAWGTRSQWAACGPWGAAASRVSRWFPRYQPRETGFLW